VNDYVKRKTIFVDKDARRNMAIAFTTLIDQAREDSMFLMHGIKEFWDLSSEDRVNICGGDLFHSIGIQTCDLVTHMLMLWSENGHEFLKNIKWSIQETLRLYPLSDCFYRYTSQLNVKKPWLAPLTLVHRNKAFWKDGDKFIPTRWQTTQSSSNLLSYSGGKRRCPSANVSETIAMAIVTSLSTSNGMWLHIVDGFSHERILSFGLPAKVGTNITDSNTLLPPVEEQRVKLSWPKYRLWLQRYWNSTIRMYRKGDVW